MPSKINQFKNCKKIFLGQYVEYVEINSDICSRINASAPRALKQTLEFYLQ